MSHFLGTVHHEYVFTVEEALDALPDVGRSVLKDTIGPCACARFVVEGI